MKAFIATGLLLVLSSLLLADAARVLKAGNSFAAWPAADMMVLLPAITDGFGASEAGS